MTSPRVSGRRLPFSAIPPYFPLSLGADIRVPNREGRRNFRGITTGLSPGFARVALDGVPPGAALDWIGAALELRIDWPAAREGGGAAELLILGPCTGFHSGVVSVSIERYQILPIAPAAPERVAALAFFCD